MFEFSNDSTGFSDADVQNILETLFNVEGIDLDTVTDIVVRDMYIGKEGWENVAYPETKCNKPQ